MDTFRYPSDDPTILALQALALSDSSLLGSCSSAVLLKNRIRNLRVTGVLRWTMGPRVLLVPALLSLCGCVSTLQHLEGIVHRATDCIFDHDTSKCSDPVVQSVEP